MAITILKLTDTFNTFMTTVNSIITKLNSITADSSTITLSHAVDPSSASPKPRLGYIFVSSPSLSNPADSPIGFLYLMPSTSVLRLLCP